ncbi:MAG TPA: phospholipid carrier-dependent glycosyltransferase [Thermoanaerobaculia bacterium]|nr:phospholipid carrier-dependent glycosyltransferase [Thermoanaerobaculia bacterium]
MAILLLLTALQAGLAVGSLRNDSATADEGAHIASGWLKLVYGRLDFYAEQPPLMNAATAVPLLAAGYDFPLPDRGRDHWGAGDDYLFRSGYDSRRILLLARIPTVVLFVALAWSAYLFVAGATGSAAWGLAAFVMTAFDPNLLAHGRLATVDMAATFFCFAAMALLVRVIRSPSLVTGALLGVATAAAALSKTSGLILLPFGALVLAAAVMARQTPDRRRLALSILSAAGAAVLTIEVVVLGLAGDPYIARQFPSIDTPLEKLTLPFRMMAANVRMIRDWYDGSHFAVHFLLGRFASTSWWYYYPVALFYKMTIPALVLAAGGMAALLRRRASLEAACSLGFAALFLAAAMRSDIALGVRYVLPMLPPLYCGALISLSGIGSRRMAAAAAALVVWHAGETIAAYPSYIGYFNQMIGSHRNADRYLIDSNLDWGQDLRRLGDWCRQNGVEAIAVCYFGGGDPGTDVGIPTFRVWSVANPDVPPGMVLALSRHQYRVSAWQATSKESWRAYLRRREARYVTTVGDSIDIYRMDAR